MLPLLRCVLAACLIAVIADRAPFRGAHAATRVQPLSALGVALGIERTGIYRLTGQELRAHSFDWTGVRGSDLALVSGGVAVPRMVSTTGPLDDRSYIEFYGTSIYTFYTGRNIYYLRVDHTHALDAATVPATPRSGTPPSVFQGRYTESRRTLYEPMAKDDQWLFGTLTAITPPKKPNVATHLDATFSLPAAVTTGKASITFAARGAADLPGPPPQHHLIVFVNGHHVADQTSAAFEEKVVTTKFPAQWLQRGKNVVRFQLPGDVRNKTSDGQDANIDAMEIRTFALRYPHSFVATDGSLAARIPVKPRVVVSGLRTSDVAVWRLTGSQPERLTQVTVRPSAGGYAAEFAASKPGQYRVQDMRSLLVPRSFTHVHSTAYLAQGPGQLLVIGARKFFSALAPLVRYHQTHGMTVKLVDVADIYTRYSAGVLDATAIQTYIADARKQFGTQSVLLVGADTYDYHHYVLCRHRAHDKKHGFYIKNDCTANPNDRVFVPSLYVDNVDFGRIPSDWKFVGTTPVAIGRIPAVNADQVRVAVRKSLQYARSSGPRQALFSAGAEEPDFADTSDSLAKLLPSGYTITRAYNKVLGPKKARVAIKSAIDRGVTLVDYVGHGNLEQWGMPPAVLTVGMVPKLRNKNRPAVFLGWGCQTAYDPDPTDQALNARLLFAPNGGAALTLGSTGLDNADVQATLARVFFDKVFRDPTIVTIGQALQTAKIEALSADPSTMPPAESYELYGDPALPVAPLRTGG